MTNMEYRNLQRKIDIVQNAIVSALDSINKDIADAMRDEDDSRLSRLADRICELKCITSGLRQHMLYIWNFDEMYSDTMEKWYDVHLHRNRCKYNMKNNPFLSDIDKYRSFKNE